jgi:hypothetical protein
MRLIKLVSLTAYCGRRFSAKKCRFKGVSNKAGHLTIVCVVLLMSSKVCADDPASTAPHKSIFGMAIIRHSALAGFHSNGSIFWETSPALLELRSSLIPSTAPPKSI